jgi:hypothetical protein
LKYCRYIYSTVIVAGKVRNVNSFFIFYYPPTMNTKFGAGDASRYGYGSDKMIQLLAAPALAPQQLLCSVYGCPAWYTSQKFFDRYYTISKQS